MAQSLSNHAATEAVRGNLTSYVAGFVLSVILTIASFVMIPNMGLSTFLAMQWLASLAIIQILVHVVFFLHMSPRHGNHWNLLAFGYTVLCVLFLVIGTMWVMNNVGHFMMSR